MLTATVAAWSKLPPTMWYRWERINSLLFQVNSLSGYMTTSKKSQAWD